MHFPKYALFIPLKYICITSGEIEIKCILLYAYYAFPIPKIYKRWCMSLPYDSILKVHILALKSRTVGNKW